MSNYVPRIETSASDIDAINSQVGIDWYQLYKSQVDETSEVDIKYMNIYLWQICNSTYKSMTTFQKYTQGYRDKIKMSIVDQRESETGQEIAQTNFDTLTEQAKTMDALYRKYEAMHTAVKKLYLELYKEDFTKRKLPQKSKGQMRTLKDMTPSEVASINSMVDEMLKQ
jgi:arylamine N-acetyltransferase